MKKFLFSLSLLIGLATLCGAAACGKHEHELEFNGIKEQAGCTVEGTEEYLCRECGYTELRQITALGHDWGDWNVSVAATCLEAGEEVRTCKRDASHSESREIAPEHDWDQWEISTPATCLRPGLSIRICKADPAHYETHAIKKLEHNWGEWSVSVPATCLETGEEVRTCRRDSSHSESREIEMLEHNWGEWSVSLPATCIGEGLELSYCENMTHNPQKRMLEPLGHDISSEKWVVAKAASCIAAGREELLCDRCSAATEINRIPVTPHEYLNGRCKACNRRDRSTAQIDDPDLYNSEYGLKMLAEEENGASMQALYLLIDTDARQYHNGESDSKILGEYDFASLGLSADEMVAVWKTYLDDHPLYYWLGRQMSYSADSETVELLIDEAYANHEMRYSLNRMIYEKASAWREDTAEIAYLAALSYHDKIIAEVDYLESGRIYPEGTSWAHNIVGVFEGKGAVCEGYARSFQLLLNMTGIENIFVTGYSGSAAHAWNLVKLDDGRWYEFDLTFDDAPRWMWGVQYNYFAVLENQNIAWSDGGWKYAPRLFSDEHTPASGTAADFLVSLPETSRTPYQGIGELLLRQTFSVGEFTYAVVGYRAVQLINCTATGDVAIPETVAYDGELYDVISVGTMDRNKLFPGDPDTHTGAPLLLSVFQAPIDTLQIPASIRFLWADGIPNRYGVAAYQVAEENEKYLSIDGALYTKPLYTLISYPCHSSQTEYVIPAEVTFIAEYAFLQTPNLRSFTIGKDVTHLGNFHAGNNWAYKTEGSRDLFAVSWVGIFSKLPALETVLVDPENPYFTVVDNRVYDSRGRYGPKYTEKQTG